MAVQKGTEQDVSWNPFLLTLFGVLVVHLFTVDDAAFPQRVRHRPPLVNQVRKASLEREESMIKYMWGSLGYTARESYSRNVWEKKSLGRKC